MEIVARFDRSRLDHTQDNNPYLVVTLKAPTLDWMEKRPQLCVVPVIDLSGSMAGAKLTYAKESLLKLVDQLQDGDIAGLVAFESHTHILAKPQEVTGEFRDQLKGIIRGLQTMGGTNFAGGMTEAIKVVQQLDLPVKFLKRIIMFTDGQPTEGITNTKAILAMLEKARGSVTLSAFGYGEIGGGTWGGCDQQFLTDFSNLGRGNYAYVQNPDDALAAFGKELGGLLSTYATNLRVTIEPEEGHHIKRVVTEVEHEMDVVGVVSIPINDILSEETRHLVFETAIEKQSKAFPRDTTVFDVKLRYQTLTEDGKTETHTAEAPARLRFVRANQVDEPNKAVEEIINLHRVIRAQLDAEEQAKKGDFQAAQQMMQDIAKEVKTSGGLVNENIAAAAQHAGLFLADAASYNAGQGYLRSYANGGTRAYGTSGLQAEAAVFLSASNVQCSNNAMEAMVQNFTTNRPTTSSSLVIPASTPTDKSE